MTFLAVLILLVNMHVFQIEQINETLDMPWYVNASSVATKGTVEVQTMINKSEI